MENFNDKEREGWDDQGNRLIDILPVGTSVNGNINDLEQNSRSQSGAIKVNII